MDVFDFMYGLIMALVNSRVIHILLLDMELVFSCSEANRYALVEWEPNGMDMRSCRRRVLGKLYWRMPRIGADGNERLSPSSSSSMEI